MSAPNAFLAVLEAGADRAVVGALDELGVGQPRLAEASRDRLDVDGPDLLDRRVELVGVARWRSASRMRCSSSLDLGERPGPNAVGRQRLRERDEPLHRPRAALRQRLRRQRVPQLPHRRRRSFGLGRSSLAVDERPSCSPRRACSSIWPVRNLTTFPAVVRSKNGRMQSTELSRSSPGTRRASGLRTIRPSS